MGIFIQIASSALLPRNDAGNSRIPQSRDPRVKPEDDKESQAGDDTNKNLP